MKIQKICSSITDGSHNPPQGVTESEYLMLSSKNVFDDNITFADPRFLCKEDIDMEDRRTNIQAGDVLLTIVGTVGRCAVVPERAPKFTLQRSVAVLHPREDICSSRFLMYALQGKKSYIEGRAKGVAQKGIYLGEVANIEVSIPEKSTQTTIVMHLDKIASIIQKRQQQLSELDDLIKARFVEMFGDMVLNPNGWDRFQLGEVCDVRDGTHDSPQYYSEGYPLVTSKNVTGGKIDLTDCSLICEDDYQKINQRSKVDYGDILMPMIGTVGKPVIVNLEPVFAIKNVALIKFKKESKVRNTFVKALLESDYYDNAVLNKVRGGTQKFISLGDIRKLEICLPPTEIQMSFEDFIVQVDKSKVVVQKALDEAQLLFDSLMQEYFG